MNANNEYFSKLYNKYRNRLYGFGIGMKISHDTCLDIIQDVFYSLMEKNIVFDGFDEDSMKQYLFRSFINRYLNIQKSRKKEVLGDFNDLPYTIEASLDEPALEGYIINQEEKDRLKKKVEFLLGILTQHQRKAVYLRYMEEMEYEDIGKILDMAAESVRKLVFRGLEKIRKHVRENPVILLLSLFFRKKFLFF